VSAGRCIATLTPLAPNTTALPDAVLFESRGAVLLIGDDAGIAPVVEEVAKHHRTTVFAPGIDEVRFPVRVTTVGTRVAALQGRFGAFRGQVRGPEGMKDIGAASPNRDGLFDLVLDLGRQPLVAADVAPLGYFAPGVDPAARAAAIDTMRTLVGSFTKPRYFNYQAELCAHGASGLAGCTRCLDVCSTSAITSAGSQIRVDPHLCQGCATCTLACPTGALSFRLPTRDTLRRRLADALQGPSAPPRPVLVVHGQAQAEAVQGAAGVDAVQTLAADPLPAFGEELWFEAFTLGAQAVVLIDDDRLAPASRVLIAERVAQARLLLRPFGLPAHRLGFVPIDGLTSWLDDLARSPDAQAGDLPGARSAAAPLATPATKRLALLDAFARLGNGAAAAASAELPASGCFGEVLVDRKHCTLCFACVNLCPTGALSSDEGGTPRLRFAEDACVQCGLCERGCPEKAVSLHRRFRPQASARGATRVLNEDALLPCTTCGTPFISRKLLASSFERLKDHPVLAQGGRERLMTCPACRQIGLLQT
jgi:ferredoxin